MNELVIMHDGRPMVTSELVAKKFNKAHRDVMRAIKNIDCSDEFSVRNFAQSTFQNDRGREYDCYLMTRDGFSFLCMGFTGKEAAKWKEAYIEAFNTMENKISKESDKIEWKQARLQSKAARRSVTDTISDFVEYAKTQGSKSSNMYYGNITKMEYKALELIAKNEKVPNGFRDTLDTMDLSFLTTAEYVARKAIQQGMGDDLHYKEIYIKAKEAVTKYAATVTILKLN